MTDALLLVAFVIGALVANALFWQYLFRSPWRSSVTGWVLVSLFGVFALGYVMSSATLLWPGVFKDSTGGLWIRIGLRYAIDVVLIGMYVLLWRAQRRQPPGPTVDIISTEPETVRHPDPKGTPDV